MNVLKMILTDIDSRTFWVRQFGEYDETNYKNSPFYQHDYNLFHVERSFSEWIYLTAWSVYQLVWNKRLEMEFAKVSPTLSQPVDNLVKVIRQLIELMNEVNK